MDRDMKTQLVLTTLYDLGVEIDDKQELADRESFQATGHAQAYNDVLKSLDSLLDAEGLLKKLSKGKKLNTEELAVKKFTDKFRRMIQVIRQESILKAGEANATKKVLCSIVVHIKRKYDGLKAMSTALAVHPNDRHKRNTGKLSLKERRETKEVK